MNIVRLLVGAALALGLSASGAAAAGYPSKDINFVIPYGPGGGFDVVVRAISPFLEKYLPGHVQVVPQNTPGAGGMRGATAVYRARPDGYTIGIFNMPGFVLPRVLGQHVSYDLSKVTWLGRIESNDYALVVQAKSNIKNLDDLKKLDKVTVTSTGWGSTALAASQIMAKGLGLKNTVYLTGYSGTTAALVGLVRGDGNLSVAPIQSVDPYVRSGDMRILAVTGDKGAHPGLKTFGEQGYAELDGLGLERSVGAPPNLDPAAAKALDAALQKAMKDPKFIALAKKAKLSLAPLGPAATAARVKDSLSVYAKYKPVLGNPAN